MRTYVFFILILVIQVPMITFAESNFKPGWQIRTNVTVPAFKITIPKDRNSDDPIVDTELFTGIAGGISYKKLRMENNEEYSDFSVSLITLLTSREEIEKDSSNTETDRDKEYDVSIGCTIGLVNDWIQIGIGYDLGSIDERERIFVLFGFGITTNF